MIIITSNLRKACVTRDSTSATSWKISVQQAIKNNVFRKCTQILIPLYRGLLEPTKSKLRWLKSQLNAAYFIRRLTWSNSSNFGGLE